jgi:hypothetical protein
MYASRVIFSWMAPAHAASAGSALKAARFAATTAWKAVRSPPWKAARRSRSHACGDPTRADSTGWEFTSPKLYTPSPTSAAMAMSVAMALRASGASASTLAWPR